MAHGGEGAFDEICGPQVLPVLGREIVEREQRLAILLKTFGSLVVFDLVALDEGVESNVRIHLRFVSGAPLTR